MPLDAIMVKALAAELDEAVREARVEKVHQPERDVVVLTLRGRRGVYKLLISAGTGNARVHLTERVFENPQNPPMFCMLLRKYLGGGRIKSVSCPENERIIEISFAANDEMGEQVERKLVAEMIGRRANLVLVDGEGRITDCVRRTDDVQPGRFYRDPPKQGKSNPFTESREGFIAGMRDAPDGQTVQNWLIGRYEAVSPLISRELAYRGAGAVDVRVGDADAEQMWTAFAALRETVENGGYRAQMLYDGERAFEISAIEIKQYGKAARAEETGSFSELLDRYYTERDTGDRVRQKTQGLIKTVRGQRDKTARKLGLQRAELEGTRERERMREIGDIIKANLHRIKKGMTEIWAEDFYTEGTPEVRIELDERRSGQENAARYYKKYTKAKNAETALGEQIEKAETELEYLESVLESLERVGSAAEIAEIRSELTEGGYVRGERNEKGGKSGKKGKKGIESQPLRYETAEGVEVYVGRNNLQNERLTVRSGYRNEVWLHTQKIPGAHVIIRRGLRETDEETLIKAAKLAAYHSKGRAGQNVAVDYTMVKNVRKRAGSKPGMVIYTDYKTVYVTPEDWKEK